MELIVLTVIAFALLFRLTVRLVWQFIALLAIGAVGAWGFFYWDPLLTILSVAGCIMLGLAIPDIFHGMRDSIKKTIRSLAPYLVVAAAILVLYLVEPDLLGMLLVMGFALIGLWIMIRSFRM